MMGSIPVNEQIQLRIIKELIDFRFSTGVINKRYLSCLKEALGGLGISEETTNEEIIFNYKNVLYKNIIRGKKKTNIF